MSKTNRWLVHQQETNNVYNGRPTNFTQFLDYCLDFYGAGGLYDISATREELALATLDYLDRVASSENITWGDGDSVDRERVRDILIERRYPDDLLLVIPIEVMVHATYTNKKLNF
tara:strand:+ start:480 stop:827 length:348 start_codon:yes stop_codon:yes gene_type:complete